MGGVGMRKLHLGCGQDKPEGWINIDYDPHWNPDLLRDLARGLPYDDKSVDEIYTKNCLEHIAPDELQFVLRECKRVLKVGGTMKVIVPLGVVPDLTHKTFFAPFTFENFIQQDYRYGFGDMQVVEKTTKHNGPPFDYDELVIVLERGR